jgi:serine/threonine-protein kinase SRPK3
MNGTQPAKDTATQKPLQAQAAAAAAAAAPATAANGSSTLNKKRKKDGLKPIITNEGPGYVAMQW